MTNSGHVYLEEFTDALLSLDWSLPVGTPVPRKDPQQTHPECETEIIPQQQFRDDPVEEDLNFISQEDEEQIP